MLKLFWLPLTAACLFQLQATFSQTAVRSQISTSPHPAFPYELDEPDATFELPDRLKEVSGLSMTADGQHLAAIDDEKGVIFLLDKNTGAIMQEVNFWEDGDYEGLEIVGNDAFAVKSSGKLFLVKNFLSENRETVQLPSCLNKENDVEGLGFDPLGNRLLVGCKGKGEVGENGALKRAIYAFSLDKMEMLATPVFMLTLENIQAYLDHCQSNDHKEKLQEYFTPGTPELKFSPSGIAVHPVTGEIYVTSSTGKMLLVLTQEGKIVNFEKLKKTIHTQPEGLCFDADGTLFISNEGKEGVARIYKFRYRN